MKKLTPFFRCGLNHNQGTFLLWTKLGTFLRGHFYCGMTKASALIDLPSALELRSHPKSAQQ